MPPDPDHSVESARTVLRPLPVPVAPSEQPARSLPPTPVRTGGGGSLPGRGQLIGGTWQIEQMLGVRGPVVVLAARCARTRVRVALRVLVGGPRPDAEQLLMPQDHGGRVLQCDLEASLPFVAIDYLPEAVSFWGNEQARPNPSDPPPPAPVAAPRGALVAMAAGLALRIIVVAVVIASLTAGSKSAGAMSPDAMREPQPQSDTLETAAVGIGYGARSLQDRMTRLSRALLAESEEQALQAALSRVDLPVPVADRGAPGAVPPSAAAPGAATTPRAGTPGAATSNASATPSGAAAANGRTPAGASARSAPAAGAAEPPASSPAAPRAGAGTKSSTRDPMDKWQ